jgi:hypothetical protein
MAKKDGGGGGGTGGGGKKSSGGGGGSSPNPNWPSKTGKDSGGKRGNAQPKSK